MGNTLSNPTRADALRNRETLIAAASAVYATAESEPTMRVIAASAGVGVGTLYRHFPTREALVEAVYRDQLHRLHTGAEELLGTLPPAEALRRWMDLFAEWVATKRGMIGTLQTMIASGDIPHAQSRIEILAVIDTILAAGHAAGDIRPDTSADDIAASLIGIFTVVGTPAQAEQARRLLDLLMDGLRYCPGNGNSKTDIIQPISRI